MATAYQFFNCNCILVCEYFFSGRWEPFDCFVIDELNQLKFCREILKVP